MSDCKCGLGLRKHDQVPNHEIDLMKKGESKSCHDLTIAEANRIETILNNSGLEVSKFKNIHRNNFECENHWHIEILDNQPKALVEVTDLYGGEANYSWVHRHSFPCFSLSDRKIVTKAKAMAGWTGFKTNTEKFGDMIKIRPLNQNIVMFITFE